MQEYIGTLKATFQNADCRVLREGLEGGTDLTWTQGTPHKVQFSSKLEFSTVSSSPIVGSIVLGLVPLTEQWGAARNLGTGRTGFDQRDWGRGVLCHNTKAAAGGPQSLQSS